MIESIVIRPLFLLLSLLFSLESESYQIFHLEPFGLFVYTYEEEREKGGTSKGEEKLALKSQWDITGTLSAVTKWRHREQMRPFFRIDDSPRPGLQPVEKGEGCRERR